MPKFKEELQLPSLSNIVRPANGISIYNDGGSLKILHADGTTETIYTGSGSNIDLSNYYTKTQVDNLVSGLSGFSPQVVQTLPNNPSTGTLYLVPAQDSETGNAYDEYLYINNDWEKIGTTAIDLSGYALTTDIPVALSQLSNDVGYLTEHQSLANYVTSSSLNTTLSGYVPTGTLSSYYTSSQTDSAISNYAYSKSEATSLISAAIPSNISSFTNDSGYITSSALSGYALSSSLATVATSGSYNDLSDKPTIPAAQIQSDWNQSDSSALDFIKNKPTIPTVPTNVSDFTNDAGYITSSALSGYATTSQLSAKQDTLTPGAGITIVNGVISSTGGAGLTYSVEQTLPASGQSGVIYLIPNSGSGSNIYDEYIYVNNNFEKIGSTQADLTNYALKSELPTKVSDLTNDSGFTTNAGTVTSVRVQAGTGLTSSVSTAQASTLNTTISIASGYKLPTTSEWSGKQDASTAYSTSNIVYSATEPSDPIVGMIWLKPIE